MLGPYESTDWWDHVTHTVSAGLVAALAYAALTAVARGPAGVGVGPVGVGLGPVGVAGATVAFVMVVGVFWELVELFARHLGEQYGIEPVLVHYGRRDTALDLLFDLVGALAVVTLDVRWFVPIAERHPRAAATALFATGVAAVVGSVLLAVIVTVDDS
jgi:hypothetical protein